MRKHIYLHTSNLKYITTLKEEELFEFTYSYNPLTEMSKTHQNEYGRIKTNDAYYHILIGNIRKEGCLWCQYPLKAICKHIPDSFPNDMNKFDFYCLCEKCGGRGPSTFLNINSEEEGIKDIIEALVMQKYQQTVPWETYLNIKEE